MITLLTGLPGASKTLFLVWLVLRYQVEENKRLEKEASASGVPCVYRQVFYSGIKEVRIGEAGTPWAKYPAWTEIDPGKWMACPPGSIIVIDEAQYIFSKKPNGSDLPVFYKDLATHRHHGFDMFFLTQHPTLLDNFVRKLTGRHYHSVRKFGMHRSTVYEWDKSNDAPEKLVSQKQALNVLKWPFAKELYGSYKSAEVHTVKRTIPIKIVLAILFVIGMIFSFYFALDYYQNRAKGLSVPVVAGVPAGGPSTPGQLLGGLASGVSEGVAAVDPLKDAKRFVFESTPRVVGVAHTAPKYDGLTKPVRVPVPAMCIRKKLFCKCYSQQGTPMQVPTNMCYEISYAGFFQEFDPDGPNSDRQAEPLPSAPPRSDVAVASVAQNVVVIPYQPNTSVFSRSASTSTSSPAK